MSPDRCPKCGEQGEVLSTYHAKGWTNRRRECGCGARWTAIEILQTDWQAYRRHAERVMKLRRAMKELD